MTRPVVRTMLGVLAAAVALALAAPASVGAQTDPTTTAAGGAPATTGPPETPSGDPAIDDLVSCVQGSRQLLVLMLIDESASLKQTDPDDRRVDAARGALDSLIALSSGEGAGSPDVEVALAAFSNEYRLVQDWTPAGEDTAAGLNASLDEFADFNKGIDTDFVNALSAGQEALADQAAAVTTDGGDPPCRAVMLFTDGGYDLAVRTTEADQERLGTTKPYAPGIELTTPEDVQKAEALGRKALCDPGKLADRLRRDDITLLTVALSGDVARRSQLPLAAATTGRADDYTCGTQPEGDEVARPQGAYLPAEDIDVLVTQFNGVGTRLAGGNLVPGTAEVKVCGEDPCDEGSRTFTLDKSLRRAQILALPSAAGAQVELEGPNGESVTISEAGESEIGATRLVTRSVAGRGFAINLDRPAELDSWNGEWTVSVIDPSGDQAGDDAILQIYVFSDIGVELAERPQLERGAETEFKAVFKLPKGVKAADVIASATAEVRLRDPLTGAIETVPLEGPPTGPFTGTYETPASTTSNAIEATAAVRIATTGGAALVSQAAPVELLVRRPVGSIQFAPASLQMPSLTGEGSTEVDLILIGGEKDGCVWFGNAEVPDPPDGAGTIELSSSDGALPSRAACIKVPAKETVNLTVVAAPSGRASGTVSGDLEVFEQVEGAAEPTATKIPFRFDMARGVDEAQRLLLSLLLLVVGLGLPMAALLLLNALTARFQSLDAVRGTALPVSVQGTTIQRTDGAYPRALSLRPDDFGNMAATGSDRRFTFGGVEFRARASRNPFGATIAMAAPEGGAEKLKGRAGSRVELDPSLAGSWIFLLDSDQTRLAGGTEVVGLLIAFVAEGDIPTQTARMLPVISRRLPDTAARLAGLVRSAKRKPVKDPKPPKAAPPEAEVPAADPMPADEVDAGPSITDAATADTASEAPTSGETPPEPAPETAEVIEDTAAPAAPTGFGGRTGSAVPPTPSVTPVDDDAGDEGDGPGGPPIGFGGIRPDA